MALLDKAPIIIACKPPDHTASSPIPILGVSRPDGTARTTPSSTATSPAAAFAKLGLSESGSTATSTTQQASSIGSKIALFSKRVTSSSSTKRRVSSTTKRATIAPHLHFRDSSGLREGLESHSLPASSLLLLSSSAEAAVLESMRFEQGERNTSLGISTALNGTSAPTGSASLAVNQAAALKAAKKLGRLGEIVDRDHAGKKDRGQLFKCEKCSKVYRHPQCLVKHRWEHTSVRTNTILPAYMEADSVTFHHQYWAEASKLMLSKHQQVQMLEAAAILATPSGSLPESRSLWPAAVSPSAAGLYGSDRVNLDVIRESNSPLSRRSVSLSSSSIPMSTKEEERDVFEDEDGDDVMFDMSINGDDAQSVSGASTTDTTSGKGSGDDEKDSGYASGSAKDGMMMEESSMTDVGGGGEVLTSLSSSLSSSSHPAIAFSVSAPPPMGYFDTRDKSIPVTSNSTVPSLSCERPTLSVTLNSSPPPPSSLGTSSTRGFGNHYSSLSRMMTSTSTSWHSPTYTFTPEYAASDLRSSCSTNSVNEEESTPSTRRKRNTVTVNDLEEKMGSNNDSWNQDVSVSDEVADMEL